MAQTTAKLLTTGMHCSSCSMLIDMTLSELDGVTESSTDHASGESVVTFDADVVSLEQIIEAIRGAGYDAVAGV